MSKQTPEQRKAKAMRIAAERSRRNQATTDAARKAARKLKKEARNERRDRDNKRLRERAAESGLIIADRVTRSAIQEASDVSQEAAAFEREVSKS